MKVIGYVCSNETGIHVFCTACVSPEEKGFGPLLPVYKSSRKCAFCNLKLNNTLATFDDKLKNAIAKHMQGTR